MSLTTRLLPSSEWGRLAGTDLAEMSRHLNPETAGIVVVEAGGAILGAVALFPALHAEGLWIAPAHRGKTAVARRLWTGLLAAVRMRGARGIVAASMSDGMDRVLARLGATALPGTHYTVPFSTAEGVSSCPQQ